MVAVVPYGYLMNLLEALEDAIDRTLLKNAVAGNDDFFSFEEVIKAHNQAHNVEEFARMSEFAEILARQECQ